MRATRAQLVHLFESASERGAWIRWDTCIDLILASRLHERGLRTGHDQDIDQMSAIADVVHGSRDIDTLIDRVAGQRWWLADGSPSRDENVCPDCGEEMSMESDISGMSALWHCWRCWYEEERQRRDEARSRELVRVAGERVDETFVVGYAQVGEPSNGALITRLAGEVERLLAENAQVRQQLLTSAWLNRIGAQ